MTQAGRPSDYDSEYHPNKLLELMSLGKTNVEVCAELGISESTLLRWRKANTELNEAYEKGLASCEVKAVIEPLKKMIVEGHEKGLKAVQTLAKNKFGYDKQNTITNATQINIGSINITSKEEFEKLQAQIKDDLIDLNIIDADFLKLDDKSSG